MSLLDEGSHSLLNPSVLSVARRGIALGNAQRYGQLIAREKMIIQLIYVAEEEPEGNISVGS